MHKINQNVFSALKIAGNIRRIESYRRRGTAAIAHQRDMNLKNLLRYAKLRSPFQAKRLAHIDPDRFDIRDIEPADKHVLMANFEDLVTDRSIRKDEVARFVEDPEKIGTLYKGRYIIAHTSGSTGTRGYFLSDLYAWEMAQALALTGKAPLPASFGDLLKVLALPFRKIKVAAVIPLGGHYTSYLMPVVSSDFKDHFVNMHYMDILDPFSSLIKKLNDMRPDALHSYPTMVDSLAIYALSGHLTIRPRIITVAAEPFSDDARRRINQAWPGVAIINIYASTEAPAMAKVCPKGRMHYQSDYLIIENYDRNGREMPVGQRGDLIYITSLYNFTQPLIRYEMTDAVRFHPDPCPCGYPTPTLEIFGRTNDTLWIPNRVEKWISLLPTPVLVAFMDVPGLHQYQIVQNAPRSLHINYSVGENGSEKIVHDNIEKVFQAYLARHGLDDMVTLTYKVVPCIERDARSHKILQIINNIGPPGGAQ